MFEEAEQQALLMATENAAEPELCVVAYLLAAECAAKQGSSERAEKYLKQAQKRAPQDSEYCQEAMLNLGKVYLRRGEVYLAEQVYTEALSLDPSTSKLYLKAIYNLAQVHEAKRCWRTAADLYQKAAHGFESLGQRRPSLSCYQNEAWMLLVLGQPADLETVHTILDTCEKLLASETAFRYRQIQDALSCYYLYVVHHRLEAERLASHVLDHGGPSKWATCVAAYTAGKLALENGLLDKAIQALQIADAHISQAVQETAASDVADLLSTLRYEIMGQTHAQ